MNHEKSQLLELIAISLFELNTNIDFAAFFLELAGRDAFDRDVRRLRDRNHRKLVVARAVLVDVDLRFGERLGDAVRDGLGLASRHSVSAKMRIEPPAVLTYSTFPADIQL